MGVAVTDAAPAAEHADGLPMPRRAWAILTIAVALTVAVLDSSIANIALPAIAKSLDAGAAEAIWVVNAYQLAITVLLLPLASMGDIHGYRRVYCIGLAVFTAASLACALSSSLTMLVAARIVQGAGAAGLMSVNAALVRFIYPRALLGRGIGINALVVATASAAGPTIAAGILSLASWHWLFAVNVPLGILAIALAVRALPANRPARHRFDLLSALFSAATFGLLITGIDGVGHSEGGGLVTLQLGAALAIGAVFVWRQTTLPFPMLPIELFRRPVFALTVATSVCSFMAQAVAFVSLPFYFVDVLGRSQVETGLLMTPWSLAVAVAATVAGRLADRHSAGLLAGLGLAALAVGLGLVALLPAEPSAADMVWRMAVCGVGFGLFQSPNNRALILSAPRERSGSVGGVQSTARLLGQTTGAALAALVFGLAANRPAVATSTAVTLAAGFAAAGAVVSFLRLLGRQGRTAAE